MPVENDAMTPACRVAITTFQDMIRAERKLTEAIAANRAAVLNMTTQDEKVLYLDVTTEMVLREGRF